MNSFNGNYERVEDEYLCQVCGPDLGIAAQEQGGDPSQEESDDDDPDRDPDEQQEIVTEAVVPKISRDPGLPTQQEREAHRATHMPYRAWCEECVMASKANPAHRVLTRDTPEIPEVGVDYGFLREEGQEESLTIMVVKDRETRATFSFMVPTKGAGWKYSVDCLTSAIDRFGHTKTVLMHDQEAALNDLCREAAKQSNGGVIQQSSPVGESQSNGRIEVAVKLCKNQIRVIKFGLERRLKCKIPQDHPIMGFLVEHAGLLITKFQTGRDDGRTAFRRLLGKDCREDVIEFGESILYRVMDKDKPSLERRWQIGTFLGRKWGTGECFVGTSEGVVRCRGFQRRPSDVRWDKAAVEQLVGTPWCLIPSPGEDARVYMPDEIFEEPEVQHQEQREKAPHRLRITRDDVMKYKFTQGCRKCSDIASGRRSRATHSAPCRKRIEAEMKKDPVDKLRLRQVEDRIDEYCVRVARGEHEPELEEALNCDSGGVLVKIRDKTTTQGTRMEASTSLDEPLPSAMAGPPLSSRVANPSGDAEAEATAPPELLDNDTEGMEYDDSMAKPNEDDMRVSSLTSTPRPILEVLQQVPPGQELERSLAALGCSRSEVSGMISEAYSVPRAAKMAARMKSLNIAGGKSYDLRTNDKNGKPWDFTKASNRRQARLEISHEKPDVLVGSPPCTDCSILSRAWNFPRMDPQEVTRRRIAASVHLTFCCQLYLDQIKAGRYFLHEHPESADSWTHPGIVYIQGQKNVEIIKSDMCQFGMQSRAVDGTYRLVQKPTKWMSNARCILRRLARRCPCRQGGVTMQTVDPTSDITVPRYHRSQIHKHTQLLSGRAAAAQEYPDDLCAEIIRGLRNQLDEDRGVENTVNSLGFEDENMENYDGNYQAEEEIHHPQVPGDYFDDITGHKLDKDLVRAARAEEVRFLREPKIYEKVPIAQAWSVTGKQPIGGRWVDHDKGSHAAPEVRSRYVAKDYNKGPQDGLFAAMPPLEAKRMLLSHVATNRRQGHDSIEVSFIDARKAYYNAKPARPVYVTLPQEDAQAGMCARLNWCMYGTREAASRWTETYTKVLEDLGFRKGKASPCVFLHQSRQLRLVVHGDDFTTSGTRKELDLLEKQIAAQFEIKIRGRLGQREGCDREIKILNRIVRWTASGITYEADPQHAQLLLRELKLDKAAGRTSPGTKEENEEKDGQLLSPSEATRFGGLAARANYLAQDRADIAFASKELCRRMSSPCDGDWAKLKRLVRYLRDHPACTYRFNLQTTTQEHCIPVDVYVDADYAGCKRTRRSTSGGMCFMGDHLVRHWSSTQKTIALSSGEAELHGIVRGASEALALRSLGWDMGLSISLTVHTDSSAAKGIAERQGIGRVRHLEVGILWIQERLKAGDFMLHKVLGVDNPGDLLTKHLAAPDIEKHVRSANLCR